MSRSVRVRGLLILRLRRSFACTSLATVALTTVTLTSAMLTTGCAVRSEVLIDAATGLDVPLPDAPMGADAGPRSCSNDLDCADRIACSVDHCVLGACEHEPCPDCCPGALSCDPGLG